MDSHNTSPSVLAKILFPELICFNDDLNIFYRYSHHQNDEALFVCGDDESILLMNGVKFNEEIAE